MIEINRRLNSILLCCLAGVDPHTAGDEHAQKRKKPLPSRDKFVQQRVRQCWQPGGQHHHMKAQPKIQALMQFSMGKLHRGHQWSNTII